MKKFWIFILQIPKMLQFFAALPENFLRKNNSIKSGLIGQTERWSE